MINIELPHFIIKRNFQKSEQTGIYFNNIVNKDILEDICKKITGISEFTFEYVDNSYNNDFIEIGYNKGRIVFLIYNNIINYISFSELTVGGRNSSVQSVPTAFNIYYNSVYSKRLFYYFLNTEGNKTEYQMLIYRLMKTIGFEFLNDYEVLNQKICGFTTIEDIMNIRKENSKRNKSNNSTYITKEKNNVYEIYGKTYGANKYETAMFCYALSVLAHPYQKLILYEILEGDLKELPKSSKEVINKMNKIQIISTDMKLEKQIFNSNLRSPRFIFNMLEKFGEKSCVLCECKIPELIQGAHIWNISDIKKNSYLSEKEKLEYATDGENGIWLCANHHKLFDENFFTFNDDGQIMYRDDIDIQNSFYINEITKKFQISEKYITQKFLSYLNKRNRNLSQI